MMELLLNLQAEIDEIVPTRTWPISDYETGVRCPRCGEPFLARVRYDREADQPPAELVVCRTNCGYRLWS